MSQTAARLLGLLSLLMVPRTWSGTELADRLEVSPRTVRNDIGALRDIGYVIDGTRGNEGGYRLSPFNSAIPPLPLDSDEAVAVAVGLHSGLSCIIGGMEETSARALAKLEHILPAAVRTRVHSLAHFTVPVAGNQPMPIVEPGLIVSLIDHCHRHERLRFRYLPEDAPGSQPAEELHLEVEPYRLVNRQHRWYLLAFDPTADDWRVFRAERISPKTPSGLRFEPRPLPARDIGDYVERHSIGPRWRHSATVIVMAPAAEVKSMIMPAEGTVEPVDDDRSLVTIGGQDPTTMALALARLEVDFAVVDSSELRDSLQTLADRLGRAAEQNKAVGQPDRPSDISG